jgi:EAL domain-containing protein (putative c-di-GMP-specific phosphodiesterase class I)
MLAAVKNLFSLRPAEPPPLCFVVSEDASRRGEIAAVVGSLGLRVEQFETPAAMLQAAAAQPPDLTFFDVGLGCNAAGEVVSALSAYAKRGAFQLMTPAAIETYEQIGAIGHLRLFGDQRGIKMLPALQPPLKPDAIKKIVQDLGLRRDKGAKPFVTLSQALKKDWLELWYQPKISLRTNRLAGAEGLIRVRHPEHGVLFPGSFLPGAGEADMLALTERVLIRALRDWETLAANGLSVKLAVNTPVSALTKLPITEILRSERPKSENWPGLILEVTEDEIINDLPVANDVAAALRHHNCSLAIDDFGAGYSSLARLKQLPFSELKIDRSYVTDCNTDKTNEGLCEVIVELAHRFELKTVAEGIETRHESHKLQGLGCHIGQGYLFAKPMERNHFVSLLRRRVVADPDAQRKAS